MVKARLFEQFKGANTLLIWASAAGMHAFGETLSGLLNGASEATIGDGPNALTICVVGHPSGKSHVTWTDGSLRWEITGDVLKLATELVKPLLLNSGHQFLDATGEAEQVIISTDEYSAEFQ